MSYANKELERKDSWNFNIKIGEFRAERGHKGEAGQQRRFPTHIIAIESACANHGTYI